MVFLSWMQGRIYAPVIYYKIPTYTLLSATTSTMPILNAPSITAMYAP